MKYAAILLIITCFACSSSSDSGPTSAEGKWTYTTPDGKVNVTFELVKTSGGSLNIQNPTIRINGTSYIAAGQISGVALPVIASLIVNANDPLATYSYPVSFLNGTVSSDFTKITAATASYVYPNGQTHDLTNVLITRP